MSKEAGGFPQSSKGKEYLHDGIVAKGEQMQTKKKVVAMCFLEKKHVTAASLQKCLQRQILFTGNFCKA